MEKFRRSWKGKPVALFLFLGCFFLFNWPLLSIPTVSGGFPIVIRLFLMWLLIIFGLWLYSRNEADYQQENHREEDRP